MSGWRVTRHYGFGAARVRLCAVPHFVPAAPPSFWRDAQQAGPDFLWSSLPALVLVVIVAMCLTATLSRDRADLSDIEIVMFEAEAPVIPDPEPDAIPEPDLEIAKVESPPPVVEPETPPPATLPPSGGRATRPPVNTGPDRSALVAGNQAFAGNNWLEATEAYGRMPVPEDANSEYGLEYQQALLRQGVAHENRAEFGAALEVLEHAASFGSPGFQTFLRLAGAQCAVGRTEEGRGTLAEVGRSMSRMSASRQLLVGALVEYERGLCSHGEFDRAETTRERVRTGSAAMTELQAFIDFGRQIVPIPDEVQPAIEDAERRIALIRRQIVG